MLHLKKVLYIFVVFIIQSKTEWIEIPQMNPYAAPAKFSGTIYYSGTKTPANITNTKSQVDNLQAYSTSNNYDQKDISESQNIYLNETLASSTTELFIDYGTEMFYNETDLQVEDDTQSEENVNENSDETVEDYSTKNENKFSSYEDVLPFLKSIQSSLINKAHKDIKSKIQVLKDLRDNLMIDIDRRLKSVWTSNDVNQSRDYKDDSHIEFPSNEGALMTIGFLTLAVFLVKLVLQVIHAIKAKKMYYNATMSMMNMNPAATLLGRKKRFVTLDDQTIFNILRSIQDLKHN